MPRIMSSGPDWSQAPTDLLDYTFDWLGGGWLTNGDPIASSTWTVTATQGTPSTPNISPSGKPQVMNPGDTVCWFTGGDDGADYVLYNQITTASGRKRTRSITIKVRNSQ